GVVPRRRRWRPPRRSRQAAPIVNFNELQCVAGRLTRLGDYERDAFADETNPLDGHHRPVRYHSTRDDPVRFDVANPDDEVGAGESKAHAGGGPSGRKAYASDESVRVRRTVDRQIKHAGQLYVIDVMPVASDKFNVLSSAKRLADIGRRLRIIGHHGLLSSHTLLRETDAFPADCYYIMIIILYGQPVSRASRCCRDRLKS